MIERKGERETEMRGGGKNERLQSEEGRERERERAHFFAGWVS